MENLNTLKSQVEELKERLGTNEASHESEAGEFKALLATIKTNLQTKQAEIERLSAENDQLRKMLDDALTVVREHQAQGSRNVLRDLHAEMAALVEPIGAGAPEASPDETPSPCEPDQPVDQAADQPVKAKQEMSETADAPAEDDDVDDSPMLRRIMHRKAGK